MEVGKGCLPQIVYLLAGPCLAFQVYQTILSALHTCAFGAFLLVLQGCADGWLRFQGAAHQGQLWPAQEVERVLQLLLAQDVGSNCCFVLQDTPSLAVCMILDSGSLDLLLWIGWTG